MVKVPAGRQALELIAIDSDEKLPALDSLIREAWESSLARGNHRSVTPRVKVHEPETTAGVSGHS